MTRENVLKIVEGITRHYTYKGVIKRSIKESIKNYKAGKGTIFKRVLYGTRYDNREFRIFVENCKVYYGYGWGKSSNKAFSHN